MTSSIQVSEEALEAGVKELRAHLDLSDGLLDELEDDSNLHVSLRAAYLAMRSKDHSIAVDDVRAVRASIETERRQWFCSGQDCEPYDHGRDEGFELALKAFDAAITAIGSQSIELPDIHAEGERLASETPKTNGAYLWTDLVGAIQTGIAEERARHV